MVVEHLLSHCRAFAQAEQLKNAVLFVGEVHWPAIDRSEAGVQADQSLPIGVVHSELPLVARDTSAKGTIALMRSSNSPRRYPAILGNRLSPPPGTGAVCLYSCRQLNAPQLRSRFLQRTGKPFRARGGNIRIRCIGSWYRCPATLLDDGPSVPRRCLVKLRHFRRCIGLLPKPRDAHRCQRVNYRGLRSLFRHPLGSTAECPSEG